MMTSQVPERMNNKRSCVSGARVFSEGETVKTKILSDKVQKVNQNSHLSWHGLAYWGFEQLGEYFADSLFTWTWTVAHITEEVPSPDTGCY